MMGDLTNSPRGTIVTCNFSNLANQFTVDINLFSDWKTKCSVASSLPVSLCTKIKIFSSLKFVNREDPSKKLVCRGMIVDSFTQKSGILSLSVLILLFLLSTLLCGFLIEFDIAKYNYGFCSFVNYITTRAEFWVM